MFVIEHVSIPYAMQVVVRLVWFIIRGKMKSGTTLSLDSWKREIISKKSTFQVLPASKPINYIHMPNNCRVA